MTHIEILRFFNKWRRGDAQSGALDAAGITPQMIGQAIDACIADAERYRWVSSGVQEAETLVSVVLCHGGDAAKIDERIATYMEANQEVRNG